MAIRMVETRPGDVIVTMNKTVLLKFIGWCEAHRPSADYEPSFLNRCLLDLEYANEGYAPNTTVECNWCGETYSLQTADEHLYQDGRCKDRDACHERSSVICAGCGAKWQPHDSGVYHDPDADGWFCSNSTKCNQRRMDGAT